MATLKAISAAMKLVDVKKENLRKALEDLQVHSSSLSSFTLTWPDLDSYFTSLQSSLEHKFKLLQSMESEPQPSEPLPKQLKPPSTEKNSSEPVPVRVPARPELKLFCENMDGVGLRRYIVANGLPNERKVIRVELNDAFQRAPDAASMVLDAMEGFYPRNYKGDKDSKLSFTRMSCMVLLEELMRLKLDIGGEVKERAMMLAVEWKGKMSDSGNFQWEEVLGFLLLLAAYGLAYGFDMDELIDYVVIIANKNHAVELCRVLCADRISDIIQKLISKRKQVMAVKFIFEFEMTDKFPPLPLLKAYVKESKHPTEMLLKSGKCLPQSLNDAIMKEVRALNSVIKCIEDYKLESAYPKYILVKRIEKLEKWKSSRKRLAAASASEHHQQLKLQKQSGSEHPLTTALAGPATITTHVAANSAVPPLQQPHLQTAGLLPEHPDPYLSFPGGPYGLAGSNPAVAAYTGSSAGLYGSSGAPLGFSGNLSPTRSNLYPSGSHIPSGYYDRQIAYAEYNLPPQYHPSYNPQ